MQWEISDNVKLGSSVTHFRSVKKSSAVHKTVSDFDNANLKAKKIRRLLEWCIYHANIACYIPGTLDLVFQGMIEEMMTIEQPADAAHSNKEMLEFELIIDNNYYTNVKSLHLCFRVRFGKLSNAAHNLDAGICPVNSFFAHWIREINITKYGQISPLSKQPHQKKYIDIPIPF